VLDSSFLQASEAAALTWEVPALAFGVSVGGATETYAIGCAPDTIFRVASITKPFTTALCLGVLDLEEQTGIWPPDVRVRHLLSHTIGLDADAGDLGRCGDGDEALGELSTGSSRRSGASWASSKPGRTRIPAIGSPGG
jgi:CubicO group peptidase (beta-lactamase class C family)